MTSNVNANFATHEVVLLVSERLAIVFRGTLLLKVGFLILILNVKISKDLEFVKIALLTDHFAQ